MVGNHLSTYARWWKIVSLDSIQSLLYIYIYIYTHESSLTSESMLIWISLQTLNKSSQVYISMYYLIIEFSFMFINESTTHLKIKSKYKSSLVESM
jgi:hypothetical protein